MDCDTRGSLVKMLIFSSLILFGFILGAWSFVYFQKNNKIFLEKPMVIQEPSPGQQKQTKIESSSSLLAEYFPYPPGGKLVKRVTVVYHLAGQLVRKTPKDNQASEWQLDNLEQGEPLVFRVTDKTPIFDNTLKKKLSASEVKEGSFLTVTAFYDKNASAQSLEITGIYVQ